MDSIIFDLDGTLWDPRDVVVGAWNTALKNEGIEHEVTKEDLKNVMGLQQKDINDKLFPHVPNDQYQSLTEQF